MHKSRILKPQVLAQISNKQKLSLFDDEPADDQAAQVQDDQQEAPAEEQVQVEEAAATQEQPADEAQAQEAEAQAEVPAEEQKAEEAQAEAPAAEGEQAAEAQPAEEQQQEVVEEKPAPKPAKKAAVKKAKAAPPKKIALKVKKAPPPVVQEAEPAQEAAPEEQQPSAEEIAAAEAEAAQQAESAQVQEDSQVEEQPVQKKAKSVASSTPDVNQAAAVANAAASLFPDEKDFAKMTPAEKRAKKAKDAKAKAAEAKRLKEKQERENPTVDENGEHIQTVAEAKEEAKQLQELLDAGTAAVEQKIQMDQERMAAEPAVPAEPVKQEEDDGHLETVEEVKAKMAAAQKQMNEGLANTENRVQAMAQENANMPDFGALGNLYGSISNMGKSRKKKQLNDMAAKLGVDVQAGDIDLSAEDLSNTLMERSRAAGHSQEEINAAMAE